MAIFKRRDSAKREQWKNAHKSALKAAVESYAFWHDVQSAYEQYRLTMDSWGERPVSVETFRANFPKLVK